jgi:hypothetical protein
MIQNNYSTPPSLTSVLVKSLLLIGSNFFNPIVSKIVNVSIPLYNLFSYKEEVFYDTLDTERATFYIKSVSERSDVSLMTNFGSLIFSALDIAYCCDKGNIASPFSPFISALLVASEMINYFKDPNKVTKASAKVYLKDLGKTGEIFQLVNGKILKTFNLAGKEELRIGLVTLYNQVEQDYYKGSNKEVNYFTKMKTKNYWIEEFGQAGVHNIEDEFDLCTTFYNYPAAYPFTENEEQNYTKPHVNPDEISYSINWAA